jgi:hypothetical protein
MIRQWHYRLYGMVPGEPVMLGGPTSCQQGSCAAAIRLAVFRTASLE